MADRPTADPTDFTQAGRKRWTFTTAHPMRFVMGPRFFDGVRHSGLAPDDEISVIALGDEVSVHAILAVDEISAERGVVVSALIEYARKKLRAAA